jgi:DNA-binding CsgD family transcriptional regulator
VVPVAGHTPLIGRSRELVVLAGGLAAAGQGQAQVVLLAGEPGIGKSRLLHELAARAQAAGATVLRGGASDAEGMPPYLPFLEALGRYIRSTPVDELRSQAGDVAPILAGILPELAQRLGSLSATYPLPPEQGRLRLWESAGALLGAIAETAPTVLILDDLHWADAAGLDLLCHIVRHQPAARLLVVGAYRDGEVAANPALARALVELTRLRVLTTVPVQPLSGSEVMALAVSALGGPAEAAIGPLVYSMSEGNPFFAEELLRGWVESGAIERHDETWLLGSAVVPATHSPLPGSITGAINQRLARLAPDVSRLLRTAAVIGRTFDAKLLAKVDDRDPETVEDTLRDAIQARLIRMEPEGLFKFGHDKVRECLYAEVTAARRTRLHGLIGRTLETLVASPDVHQLSELAFHFSRSGDRARGAQYSRRAAEAALVAYAADDALAHYRMALDLLAPGDPGRGDLLLGLGDAAMLAGSEREAATVFDTARAWFLEAGNTAAAARAAHGAGKAWWRLEEHARARAAFASALALREHGPPDEVARVLVDLASLLVLSLGLFNEGMPHARRALELAGGRGDARLEAAACRTLGNLLMRSNDLSSGIPLLERGLALATTADDPAEAAECCAHLGMAYIWGARHDQAATLMSRWLGFAEQSRDPYQLRHVYALEAALPWIKGRWSEAEARLERARAAVERLASPEPRAFLSTVRGWVAWGRGEYADAEQWFDEAITIYRTLGASVLVWYLGMLGLAYAAQNKAAQTLACMDELEQLVAAQPAGTMPTSEPLTYLAQMAVMLGDTARAARYRPPLRAFQGQFHDFLIDRLLGQIGTMLHDLAAAQASLEAAEETARRERMHPELARTLAARADLELARGGHGHVVRARDLLDQALVLFDQLEMAGEAARIRDRLQQVQSGPDISVTSALPAGLSAREAEILRLVAAGRTSREIARALNLSEKTVSNHLTSIFTKTGSDNRAAATAFAVRHGLA